MNESLEIKGYWWLPDQSDNLLPGTLTYTQEEGAILEIIGVFENPPSIRQAESLPIILGESYDGKPITLYKCILNKYNYPFSGYGNCKYMAHFVFTNVHFESEEQIKFHELRGNFSDLEAWVGINGFLSDLSTENSQSVYSIKYKPPADRLIEVNEKYKVGISFSSIYNFPKVDIHQTEAKISQNANILVKSNIGEIPFENIFRQITTLTSLLLIASQRIPCPIKIEGYSDVNRQNISCEKVIFPEIGIYYQPIEAFLNHEPKLPHEMLFRYEDLTDSQIKTWFDIYDNYQVIIGLYRTLFYSDRLFIETKFLNIAQALEALHNILPFDNNYLPPEKFEERKKKLLIIIPEELSDWVKEMLNNANGKSFRSKVYELFHNKKKIFDQCINDIDEFSMRVRDTRNEFVHIEEKTKSFKKGQELAYAIKILTMLFEIYILDSIGFPEDKMETISNIKIQPYINLWGKL